MGGVVVQMTEGFPISMTVSDERERGDKSEEKNGGDEGWDGML